jgi:hypothetical protein
MAGKPFVYDQFWVMELVETGRVTWPQIDQLMRRKAIIRENINPRANATALWRRMRSD